jgi:hypothetical protein
MPEPTAMPGHLASDPPNARGRPCSWRQRLATVGVLGVLGAAAVFVHRFDPTDRLADPTGPCLWHAATGINGPACGGTRMFYYLLHGDVVQAARHHLVALLAVPFLLYAFIGWAARAWFGVAMPPLRPAAWMYATYAVAWLLYAVVLRNLPWLPFSWFDIPSLDQ